MDWLSQRVFLLGWIEKKNKGKSLQYQFWHQANTMRFYRWILQKEERNCAVIICWNQAKQFYYLNDACFFAPFCFKQFVISGACRPGSLAYWFHSHTSKSLLAPRIYYFTTTKQFTPNLLTSTKWKINRSHFALVAANLLPLFSQRQIRDSRNVWL